MIHPCASATPGKDLAGRALPRGRAPPPQRLGLEPVFIGGPGDDLSPFSEFRTLAGAPLAEIKSLLAGASLFVGQRFRTGAHGGGLRRAVGGDLRRLRPRRLGAVANRSRSAESARPASLPSTVCDVHRGARPAAGARMKELARLLRYARRYWPILLLVRGPDGVRGRGAGADRAAGRPGLRPRAESGPADAPGRSCSPIPFSTSRSISSRSSSVGHSQRLDHGRVRHLWCVPDQGRLRLYLANYLVNYVGLLGRHRPAPTRSSTRC